MSKRRLLDMTVFEASIQRCVDLYNEGHRLIVAFSAGKDSGVMLEIAIIAAKITGNLPVDVFMADDEIMLPGTFEYAARVHDRPEVRMVWLSGRQPMANVFSRNKPYWWIFDQELDPEQWVRQPPPYIEWHPVMDLYQMVTLERFPPNPGKKLITLIGLRCTESRNRLLAIHSTKGFLNLGDKYGVLGAYPIYDWTDGDIWKAISDNKWDHNEAYAVMLKMGMNRKSMRIAPPTMAWYGADQLKMASKAWPRWFDRVCARCDGVRQVVHYGVRAVTPIRLAHETWETCYQRTCIDTAPDWIKPRAIEARNKVVHTHSVHSSTPLPETVSCNQCSGTGIGSWAQLANIMYTGDIYCMKANFLPYVQPAQFRPSDTRIWESRPSGGK